MPELSPTAIAKQWNLSKTTVYKYINRGKMSYRTDEDGHKLVDVSEAVRVLGEPSSKLETKHEQDNELVDELKSRIDSLEKQLSKRDEQFDKVLESLNNITMRLEQHPTPTEASIVTPPPEPAQAEVEPEPPQPEPPKKKRGIFKRLLTAAIED